MRQLRVFMSGEANARFVYSHGQTPGASRTKEKGGEEECLKII